MLLWIAFTTSLIILVQRAITSELAVHDKIFQYYQKNVRPVREPNTVTTVTIGPYYLTILGMNAAQESIEFSMDYLQSWKDEYLTWDPAEFNGTESIRIPELLLWVPDIAMTESLTVTPLLPEEKRKAKIDYDGTVSLWSPAVITHYCKMKIRDFPYDTQTCFIWFAPWVYPTTQVLPVIEPPTSAVSMELAGNSEWEIVSFVPYERYSNSSDGETYKELNFALTIKRNHVYYIAVMIIPTFVITTLCLLGIFSPFNNKAEREEKVSLGLTTLLTISVILNIVATEMPKASQLPLLGYFVLAELLVCMIAILLSIIIMFLHERALLMNWTAPVWLRKLLFCKRKFGKGTVMSVKGFSFINSTDESIKTAFSEISSALKSVGEWIEEQRYDKFQEDLWSEIFDSIDLVCLVVLEVANVILSVLLML